jgi:hypothetical protein
MIYAPSLLLLLLASVQARTPSTDVDLAALSTSGIVAWTLQGSAKGDRLGRSVSAAGDVNGDGFDDVLVGANEAALVYLFFGKASGFGIVDLVNFTASDSTGYMIKGSDDLLGYSVSGAGDVNGDGYDDVLVGAWKAANWAGAAYVFFGRASGFATIDTGNFTSR